MRQLSARRQPFARRQIHLRQLQPLLSPVGRNESVSENARGSPLSALSSRVQSGEVVPIRGRRSRPDWPSYLEVTISASDSRKVRDPSAPRAIRNKQQASPTQSALSRPLKNCSKKPDSALLRNLMDEFDVASTQSRFQRRRRRSPRQSTTATNQLRFPSCFLRRWQARDRGAPGRAQDSRRRRDGNSRTNQRPNPRRRPPSGTPQLARTRGPRAITRAPVIHKSTQAR